MNPSLAADVEELLLVVVLQVPEVVVGVPRGQLVGHLVREDDGRPDLGQLHAQDRTRVGGRVTAGVGRRPDLLLHLGRPEAQKERPLGLHPDSIEKKISLSFTLQNG